MFGNDSGSGVAVRGTRNGTRTETTSTGDSDSVAGGTEAAIGRLRVDAWDDPAAGPASGSFRTAGMVICPCSMATLGCIASGAGRNLIHRAAEVHLKERRPLILVPRETPLSLVTLRNMVTLTECGAVILPASPGFHGNHAAVRDLVDFIVARICDQLHVPHALGRRWEGTDDAILSS
ncbi:MAG: UbiX family flavin prenyltransferase [Planctomycetia bacterium]|nr:UbiX family flavin prenyltransferase [Planctomycetia bacterium]